MGSGRGDRVARTAALSRWTERDAAVVVGEWRRSGEPAAEFCKRYGIGTGRLWQWSSRLGRKARKVKESVKFHPVRVVAAPGGGDLQIAVGRCTVRLPRGFDAEDLRRALAVVEERGLC